MIHATNVKELPHDLSEHLRAAGIRLRPEVMYSGVKTEWVVVDESSDGRCELRTAFVRFDTEAPLVEIRRYLMGISVPSDLNETTRLAMFHPWWRGTTSEKEACAGYMARSKPMADRLREVFRDYARGRVPGAVDSSE